MKTLKYLLSAVVLTAMVTVLNAVEPKDVAGKQIEFCMLGDSITWAGDGDCFRKELVKLIPELAFVGTHTAKFGYSHAGEGGHTTYSILKIIDDKDRIPDSRYYHLLVGVNDSSGQAKPGKAQAIAERILKIIDKLVARPTTEKVFWGTIMPCSPGTKASQAEKAKYIPRDATAREVNEIMRKAVAKYGDKVVTIEYEKPLRALPGWEDIVRLHPTPAGYGIAAKIAAPYIRKHAVAEKQSPGKFGVEVTNLWLDKRQCTRPLVPGWYTVSFDVKKVDGAKLELNLASRNARMYKTPLDKTLNVPAKAGQRAFVTFMTGYEGYGYNMSPVKITAENGEIDNILVEKARPGQKPSIYGKGTYVDAATPASLGEKLVPAK